MKRKPSSSLFAYQDLLPPGSRAQLLAAVAIDQASNDSGGKLHLPAGAQVEIVRSSELVIEHYLCRTSAGHKAWIDGTKLGLLPEGESCTPTL